MERNGMDGTDETQRTRRKFLSPDDAKKINRTRTQQDYKRSGNSAICQKRFMTSEGIMQPVGRRLLSSPLLSSPLLCSALRQPLDSRLPLSRLHALSRSCPEAECVCRNLGTAPVATDLLSLSPLFGFRASPLSLSLSSIRWLSFSIKHSPLPPLTYGAAHTCNVLHFIYTVYSTLLT